MNLVNPSPSETAASVFRLSPLIRITLLTLYTALTVPLPFLAQVTNAPVPLALLVVGIGFGAVALYAALGEKVIVDDLCIQVIYPSWVPAFFVKVGRYLGQM